jgi:N-acetylneuraminic acid mutarotase
MKFWLTFLFLTWAFISIASPYVQKAEFGGSARHRSTAFAIGNSGYIGLGHINSGVDVEYEDFWRYDPASNSWTQIADYPEGKMYHAAAFVLNNKAYVGTGRREDGTYSVKFHAYDPTTNSWTPTADFIGLARRGAVGFAINGKGYVGTGQVTTGYTVTFYEYNPSLDQWSQKANFIGTPRTSAVGFSIGNYGYLGTGETSGPSTNDFYQYDPSTNGWSQKANIGAFGRQEAVGFALNGLGYIGTGDDFSSGNNFKDMWAYSPATNLWLPRHEFAGTARRYLVAFTIGPKAYLGTGTNGTNFKDFWMYNPALSDLEDLLKKIDLKLYPNPAVENLTIDLSDLPSGIERDKIKFSLFSMDGKSNKKYQFEEKVLKIEVSEFPSGSYMYRFTYEGQSLRSGKLTLKHKS